MLMSDAERERLIKLIEECSEVIEIGCKILLWGYDSACPVPHVLSQDDNRIVLAREMSHVSLWINKLIDENDVDTHVYLKSHMTKLKTVDKYLQYNRFNNKGE